jgi:hypothetical protein
MAPIVRVGGDRGETHSSVVNYPKDPPLVGDDDEEAEMSDAAAAPLYPPHERTKQILSGHARPVRVRDQLPRGNPVARFNAWLAVKITDGVGSMWCAYAFAGLAIVSLPEAIKSHSAVIIVSWISQTFLQLVLLSIIMVGQNILSEASDKRSEFTYKDAEAVLHEAREIQHHLMNQDAVLSEIIKQVEAMKP